MQLFEMMKLIWVLLEHSILLVIDNPIQSLLENTGDLRVAGEARR